VDRGQALLMKGSSRRLRRGLLASVTAVFALALVVSGVTAAVAAQSVSHSAPAHASTSARAPGGYPAPGGIYAPFTDCPLHNPLMQESVGSEATICVAGEVSSGTLTIGNISTPVVEPVDVQFGGWDPPDPSAGGDWTISGEWAGGILPPPAGIPAMIQTSRRRTSAGSTTRFTGWPSPRGSSRTSR